MTDRQQPAAVSPSPAPEPIPWPTACLLFGPVAVAGAALDLWSKHAVFDWLGATLTQRHSLIDGFLQFRLAYNEGAAFSIFHGWRYFLVTISTVALLVMLGVFISRKVTHKGVLFAMGCITGGIIGNLYDRLFCDGRVRDFIDVYVGDYHWPTLNVADSMLCIGVGLLVIINLTAENTSKP